MKAEALQFVASQVERAVIETRQALGELAVERKLAGGCSCLIPILDQYRVEVAELDDESAFRLDKVGMTITVSANATLFVWNAMYDLAEEIGFEGTDRTRAQETAVNQFLIHELFHVNQKLWDYSAVPAVKAGLPNIGLAILDLAADVEAAWVCAQVEGQIAGDGESALLHFVNALLRAYVIGAFVFDSRSSANLSYSRRSVSDPLWAFAAAGGVARTTGIAGVCFTAIGLMGFSG